ncbi:hypothetical protein HanRHA438_Chr08g0372271 [Helianthus annuus]|uniref:DUF4378 domain-containing protein n=1 Tax=Helianthus annuus TaxID=4232 RepID=A0A251VE86_HELAN|nr:protein TRM32 [Helianthus annuus]KAF5797147.1 hypothetical protein HanXRQr2_Chr08g0360261 [Helianthus annuus]KAJ0540379.1 putative protein TRM32 [Helianthus annuus]KAJ0548892.1 hypothetical protein HanIR_Chr08g0388991 [Helianthus annuus]KAJ0555120.1 putative protein TRM32 [Helianthus annuus]KAJ0720687.1 putative protein TRM32 [Helianthus annuus]
MAKVLWVEDEDNGHPGCISNIFHVKKKILPHRKGNRKYKKKSDYHNYFEVLKLFDAETSHIMVDQSNKKTFPTLKRSLKARIKAFISEVNDKEQEQEQDQDFVSSPKLQRTYSIHHLETNEWVHPIIFFPENVTETSKTHVDLTNPQVNDSWDILEMFKVDKEIFINTLQNRSLSSITEPKLAKSVSRNLMPMKLEDKLNESYSVSKAEKMRNSHDDDVIRLRRVSSLNESATRYFDFGISKEATMRASRSLKSTYASANLLMNDLSQGSCDAYFVRSCSRNERSTVSLSLHNDQISQEITQESSVLVTEYHTPDEKVKILQGFQENFEKEIKTINNKKQMGSSTKDDDFTYVKKILERSGYIKNGFQQTWHSTNPPLDPFVFQQIESHYVHDPERFAEEVNELSHRLLIFDLVDEVLLTMYERSCTYYPKELSSYCHISPAPNGSLVFDEVWKSVSRLLDFEHDINESLNDIVTCDLKSDDGWMNLQLDYECVGLDLEDLILDEVLEEVVFELI